MQPQFDWDDVFSEFLNSLPQKSSAKLLAVISNIESHGLQIAIKQQWIKKIDENLYEVRTEHNGLFLRGLYFQIKNNDYFIAHGFKKKKNETPIKEIDRAKLIRKAKE
ncbi:type II toxin-antitoxin system RelE/ParE family toxin [Vagococcus salmoninarum]|uniref:type II toxin-antitoxin system RelE/ParE family toxin n=1 Tax=Vagococcus salmoninarum TaxID=2739 RepID=UPI00187F1907|nr:type II toxin-antitoxin system RelE/ParE family toxin [Vagococcus salmoninarum]MBE9388571.1 type II toxin-antitoxin system RelE/ParE family toxin [Vagococcus salmoninarum]